MWSLSNQHCGPVLNSRVYGYIAGSGTHALKLPFPKSDNLDYRGGGGYTSNNAGTGESSVCIVHGCKNGDWGQEGASKGTLSLRMDHLLHHLGGGH